NVARSYADVSVAPSSPITVVSRAGIFGTHVNAVAPRFGETAAIDQSAVAVDASASGKVLPALIYPIAVVAARPFLGGEVAIAGSSSDAFFSRHVAVAGPSSGAFFSGEAATRCFGVHRRHALLSGVCGAR